MAEDCGTGQFDNGGIPIPLPNDPGLNVTVSAQGVFNGIKVSWSFPAVNPGSIAHFIVYRSTVNDSSLATQIAIVSSDQFLDLLEAGTGTYWYWVQIRSINGTEGLLEGPASASVLSFVDRMINELAGQITESQLATALTSEIAKIEVNEVGLTQETSDRIDGDDAVSASITTLAQQIDDASALIQTEIDTRVNQNGATATAINTVQTEVDGNTASIQEIAESTDGVGLQYTLKLDANGHVSGMGLANTPSEDDGTNTSQMIVAADRFAIVHPSNFWQATTVYSLGTYARPPSSQTGTGFVYEAVAGGTSGTTEPAWPAILGNTVVDGTVTWAARDPTSRVPFIVDNGSTFIDTAFIGNATIDQFHLKDGVIDSAKISDTLQSTGFVSGSTGWRIQKDGTAEFNGAVISRQVEVDSGYISMYGYWGVEKWGNVGPSHSLYVMQTGIPMTAWTGNNKTYLATAALNGSGSAYKAQVVTNVGHPPNVYWGFVATVLPLTVWSGPQTLRLQAQLWAKNVKYITNNPANPTNEWRIQWTIYEVA